MEQNCLFNVNKDNWRSLSTYNCHNFWHTNFKSTPQWITLLYQLSLNNIIWHSSWLYLLLSEQILSHYNVYYTFCHQLRWCRFQMLCCFRSKTTARRREYFVIVRGRFCTPRGILSNLCYITVEAALSVSKKTIERRNVRFEKTIARLLSDVITGLIIQNEWQDFLGRAYRAWTCVISDVYLLWQTILLMRWLCETDRKNKWNTVVSQWLLIIIIRWRINIF